MSAGRNGEATAEEDLLKDQSLSYRYWVGSRGDGSEAAAPAAKPKKLTVEEAAILQRNSSQGSAWNQPGLIQEEDEKSGHPPEGGTWEERTLNDWAKSTMTELMQVSHSVQLEGISYVVVTSLDSLSGDTTIVVVRNKRKHGYMLDIDLKFKGSCEADPSKVLEGSMKITEATFGDVDGAHLEVTVDGSKSGVADASKSSWESHLRSQLLPKLQERLTDFEKQLVNR